MIDLLKRFYAERDTRYMLNYEISERCAYETGTIYITGYMAIWWHSKWFMYLNPNGMIYHMRVVQDVQGVA